MEQQEHIILHLSLIDGIGPSTAQTILTTKQKTFSLSDIYSLSVHDWMNIFNLSSRIAQKLVKGLNDTSMLDKELQCIEKYNVAWTTVTSNSYPALLKNIHLPPSVLYWHGNQLKDFQRCIAVVGSRNANHYGKRVINLIVPELVLHDWIIVSGGAIGADSMAHHATLQANGKTISVFGSGLLQPYPLSNVRLFEKIVERGGTVLSSFPLLSKAKPGNFPARNRIIAGISHGCVIVQAAQKSGACITAHFSLEQGRDVFAVPGPIDDELSYGCHALIQEGAKLVNSADDILNEFGQIVVPKEVIQTHEDSPHHGVQQQILVACCQPTSIDDLLAQTRLSLHDLQEWLFDLQLSGKIQQDFTGMWITK